MPPRISRLLLTFLHTLVIIAMVSGSLAPLAVIAAPTANLSARPVTQDAPPAGSIPGLDFDPDKLLEEFRLNNPLPEGVPTEITPEPQQIIASYAEPLPGPVIPIPIGEKPVDLNTPPQEIPLQGLFGEGIPTELGRNVKPLDETTPPQAPVTLRVELDRYLLLLGEQANLSVKVGAESDDIVGDVEVSLTLPPQLQIVGEVGITTKVWKYNAKMLADRVQQNFRVEVNPSAVAELPVVTEIRLEAVVDGYGVLGNQWPVGVIDTALSTAGDVRHQTTQTPNGIVLHAPGMLLLSPASATPLGAKIQYTALFTATTPDSVDTPVAEPPSPEAPPTEALAMHLLSLYQEHNAAAAQTVTEAAPIGQREIFSSPVPTVEDNGVGLLRLWHLTVDGLTIGDIVGQRSDLIGEPDPKHPPFATPVLMVVDVADLVTAGMDMSLVDLWTRPDATHRWVRVRSANYDAERQVWVVRLNHFSDFALGTAPSQSGELLPSMQGFNSDRNTEAVTVQYPIGTPSGLGGLNPNLSLNYSSETVDDIRFALEPEDHGKHIQANVAGYGWNLGGVNYITKFRDEDDEVSYSLVLNGQSYDIFENDDVPGTYETNPYSFVAITNTFTALESIWLIKTTDGVLYEFGGPLPDLNWPASQGERELHVEMRSNLVDNEREFEVTSWYLRRVEDTVGNRMEYAYRSQRDNINTGGCYPDEYAWGDLEDEDYNNWYIRATHLTTVTWSSNVGANQGATLRTRLTYGGRSDYDNVDGFKIKDGCQPRKSNKRLETIQVEALKTDSSGWHSIRSYHLEPTYAVAETHTVTGTNAYLRHLLLSEIHEYGANGGLFNTYTFTYLKINDDDGDTENSIWLETAENGFSGKTTYEYDFKRPYCSADHGADACGPDDKRYFVSRTRVEDGQGNYYVTDYLYSTPIAEGEYRRVRWNENAKA